MLRVRNWDTWQSYRKDGGQPPWIKLHRCLIRDDDWIDLTDTQRGQLVSMWMLAADHGGVIPYDSKKVKKLLYLSENVDLEFFLELGFFEVVHGDATLTPPRRHPDATMTNQRREEAEAEAEADLSGQEDLGSTYLSGSWGQRHD